MEFDFSVVIEHLPLLVEGGLQSIKIIALSLAVGCILGLALALLQWSGRRAIVFAVHVYVEIFRTTPALLQILWFYLVLPTVTGIDLGPATAAWVALGLNTAAFLCEILKAGFQSVDKTQMNAAAVLRLGKIDALRFVILPQVIRNIFPPALALLITNVKYSSLAAGVGALELTRTGQLLAIETFRLIEFLTAVALIYFIIAYPLALTARWFEQRLRRGMY